MQPSRQSQRTSSGTEEEEAEEEEDRRSRKLSPSHTQSIKHKGISSSPFIPFQQKGGMREREGTHWTTWPGQTKFIPFG